MANQLQEAVLAAIDTLVNNRIDKIQADKTVLATIVQCTNALTNEYKVSYNGGYMTAIAQDGASYIQNATVYVLVPQGDFTQTKYIVSKAQALEDDANISFVSSALSNYNLIGKNPISDNLNRLPVGLFSYLKNNYLFLYQHGEEATAENKFFSIDAQELNNNLKEAEAIMIEASFMTRLPKLHRLSKTGVYGLQFVLAFADRDNVDEEGNPAIKYYSYTIDNNNMTGNPFLFTTWAEQYAIYPIDTENFLYIDSIMAFASDFVDADDIPNKELWGEDIFIKDVEIYGLKTITAVNGDYKLSLSMPQGSTFKSILAQDSLQVVAKVTNKTTNLSDGTMYYWFAQDNRVTSTSENYQMYGGAGWARLKDKGSDYTLTTFGNENRAYENKYLCVAVYKEKVILKEYFTLYNEAARRDLSITSSLGIKFSFDRGTPTLTCLVDGKSEDFEVGKVDYHPDSWFRFVWSKTDQHGITTIFNQTQAELQAAYDQGIRDGIGYSELSVLRSQITAMEGVEFTPGKNTFTYPVKQIDSSATFGCSVYLKDSAAGEEYYIGTAEIVLQNEGAATPNDYYILIENGDQVFQYSESGVSPDDERYTDPLEIKPLTCHFYDPAGLEVNQNTYSVKWLVPLSDSLLVVPAEGMTLNPATEKIEWCTSQVYPTAIKSNYDYQALNNQITAIVSYQGEEFTKDTNFLFTKVGENGTNGTDLVAKISPTSKNIILDSELLTLELIGGIPEAWNTGQTPNEEVLTFDLYQRNEQLSVSPEKVNWSISGGNNASNSKYASASSGANGNAVFAWRTTETEKGKFRNQIVRGSIKWEDNDYYAFYPVPVVDYSQTVSGQNKRYHVSIDSKKTLKSVTYNADGRNPLYNKNQGVFISLGDITKDLSTKYIVWTAEGGEPQKVTSSTYADNPINPAFSLIYEKNSADGLRTLVPRDNPDGTWELLTELYILPSDVYSGAYSNNVVHGKIYSDKNAYLNGGNAEVDIYIPIYMSLNTYGLASLNAWDGNHVEINEDENYILAPQIGAGAKDSENKFTGVLMGTAQTYDLSEPQIGLLGYSAGKQSIFLDAQTGNAIFGLPENEADPNNKGVEGRIKLIPGGTSEVGSWKIGDTALFNIRGLNAEKDYTNNEINGVRQINAKRIARYSDLSSDYTISVPHNKSGVLLSADPAYISIKGKLLDVTDKSINYAAANTVVQPNDAFELQLDPQDTSIFTVYRHTNAPEKSILAIGSDGQGHTTITTLEASVNGFTTPVYSTAIMSGDKIIGWRPVTKCEGSYVIASQYTVDGEAYWMFHQVSSLQDYYLADLASNDPERNYEDQLVWHREAKVGINNQGRFYTNALKDNTTSLSIGNTGAFGASALSQAYVGATFDIGTDSTTNTLMKMFTDAADVNSKTGHLYISGATDTSTEYQRPISMHGKEIALYANSSNLKTKTTTNRLLISSTAAEFGHEKSYLSIPSASSGTTQLQLENNLSIATATNRTTNIVTGNMITQITKGSGTNGQYVLTTSDNIVLGAGNNYSLTATNDFSLTGANFKAVTSSTMFNLSENADSPRVYLQMKKTAVSQAVSNYGWNIQSKTGGITLISTNAGTGIKLNAIAPNGNTAENVSLTLTPQNGGSGIFSLASGCGTISSNTKQFSNTTNTYNNININPGFQTRWGYFDGTAKVPGQSSVSVYAQTGYIKAESRVYGSDFYFNTAQTGTYNGSNYSYQSIWSHIDRLYSLLRTTRTYAQTVANQAEANAKAASRPSNWVPSWSQVTGKPSTFTPAHHTHKTGVETISYLNYKYGPTSADVSIIGQSGTGTLVKSAWTMTGGVEM